MPPTNATSRLYISPLAADNLSRVVAPEKQSQIVAQEYHTIATFPERPFAYLELPSDLAKNIKQKLNGSFLKGSKMRVEEARPEKRKRRTDAEEQVAESRAARNEERRSKRKRGTKPEEGVLKGLVLPDGRKVKRGWTGDDSKSRTKAGSPKDTTLVFRASVPSRANGDRSLEDSKSKPKQTKKGAKNLTEVKEGEKTSKFPSFIRDEKQRGGPRTTEFIEGKGWVDEDGNVVETSVKKSKPRKNQPDVDTVPVEIVTTTDITERNPEASLTPAATVTDSVRSRSGSALPITTTEATTIAEPEKAPTSALETLFKRPTEPSSKTRSTRNKPPPVKTFSFFDGDRTSEDVEAVAEVSLNSEDADASNELSFAERIGRKRPKSLTLPPQTPFTRRDLDSRALRSAAPTPDTAAIGKKFRLWGREGSEASGSLEPRGASLSREKDEDDEDEDDDDDEEDHDKTTNDDEGTAEEEKSAPIKEKSLANQVKPEQEEEQNEFEKHFYAERGAYNREWKARKREAKKNVRQTENRRGLRGKG